MPDLLYSVIPFPWLIAGIALLGLIMGSFISAVSHRLPHRQNIVQERSACPACGHVLNAWDLVPLFSWLAQRGKCRYCRAVISPRYPLIEIATATIFAATFILYGPTYYTLLLLAIAVCLLVMIVTDLEYYLIPDSIQLLLVAAALTRLSITGAEWLPVLLSGVGGLAVGLGLYYGALLWKKQEGLGWGDVKFMGVAGLFLAPEQYASFYLIAGFIGILTSLLWQWRGRGKLFPFGPALAISLYLHLLFAIEQLWMIT